MTTTDKSFSLGIHDGIPIMLGYFSVSFAFGIFCMAHGLNIWQATVVSALNVTSAGQLAGVGIMAAGGTLYELALSQAVINIRYALMSVSLSQKTDSTVRLFDRFWMSFFITDEIYAVAISKKSAGRLYMAGLVLPPFIGWVGGTLFGSAMGNVLPGVITSALGIAIYGMFIAIIVPPAKKTHAIAGVISVSVLLSCAFYFFPFLKSIPSGFSVIICSVTAAALFSFLFPIAEEKNEADR